MLNHFTSKAFLVYENHYNNYGVDVSVIGVFNTEKRANAFKEKYIKANNHQYYIPDVKVVPVPINPDTLKDKTKICSCHE